MLEPSERSICHFLLNKKCKRLSGSFPNLDGFRGLSFETEWNGEVFFLKERDPMDFRYAFMHVIDPTGKNK